MIEELPYFTKSPDWWKEGHDGSGKECDDDVSAIEITQLIKRELQKGPSEKVQIENFQQELAQMKREIAVLKSAIFPQAGPRDDFSLWSESEEATKYVGLYVAFVPGCGPIASAETIRELRLLIKEHELGNNAAIASIPDASC